MSVYVSYVAKDTSQDGNALEDSRACHVIECENHSQANEMYKSIEDAFNQRTGRIVNPLPVPDVFNPFSRKWDDTLKSTAPSLGNLSPIEMNLNANDNESHYKNQATINEHIKNIQTKPQTPPSKAIYVNKKVMDAHNKKLRNSSTESKTPSPPTVSLKIIIKYIINLAR